MYIDDVKVFLKKQENWTKFMSIFYEKNDQLMVRNFSGLTPCNFHSESKGNEIKVYITCPKAKYQYSFLLTEIKDVTEVNLKTLTQLPWLKNLLFRLIGINLDPKSERILSNLAHFIEFGHIH
ncbi:MAG: hypothetical protein ACRCXZ_08735 [Patescibacteria group bacterium]